MFWVDDRQSHFQERFIDMERNIGMLRKMDRCRLLLLIKSEGLIHDLASSSDDPGVVAVPIGPGSFHDQRLAGRLVFWDFFLSPHREHGSVDPEVFGQVVFINGEFLVARIALKIVDQVMVSKQFGIGVRELREGDLRESAFAKAAGPLLPRDESGHLGFGTAEFPLQGVCFKEFVRLCPELLGKLISRVQALHIFVSCHCL